MIGIAAILAFVVTVLSYVGVAFLIRQGRARNWVDIPNERSSHDRPTPRGGGLVIVLICLTAYAAIAGYFRTPFCWGYFAGAFAVAAVSWLDDLYSLSIGWRLLVHFAVALTVVFSCGYLQSIGLPGGISLNLGTVGMVITVIWIVWVINGYNFMDGIDGLAGIQALVASAGWSALAFALGSPGIFYFSLITLAACAGFLIHNWEPARIFMGDVGSAFLGFTFATMPLLFAIEFARPAPWLPLATVLMIWPFLFDSIFSRIRRLGRTKMVWAPHKEHLYQLLVAAGYSHATASLVYGGLAGISASTAIFAVFRTGPISFTLLSAVLLATFGFVAIVLWRAPGASTREETQDARA
jgi:UDP-N-acetylmuramyl pentapeptide phosphotransferase/UDP-N-acetylglucosamine-1-phosphate transferase